MEVQLYVLLFFAKVMCSSPDSLVFLFLLEIIKCLLGLREGKT